MHNRMVEQEKLHLTQENLSIITRAIQETAVKTSSNLSLDKSPHLC